MANYNNKQNDPFEPGQSTPEFQQYARANYAAHARNPQRQTHVQQQQRQVQPSRQHTRRNTQQAAANWGDVGKLTAGDKAKRMLGIVLCVVLAILIEVFGFNFRYFSSMGAQSAGTYYINGTSAESAGTLTLDSTNNSFEITGLNSTIVNIHFTPTFTDTQTVSKLVDKKVKVVMQLKDEGNQNYYQLPSVSVDPTNNSSTYINLEPAGKCYSIKVQLTNLADTGPVQVSGISLNQAVPLDINPVRIAYILLVLLALFALRPQSILYSKRFDGRISRHGLIIGILLIVQFVAIFILVMSNTHYSTIVHTSTTEHYFQYQKLAQALLQGHFYLNDVPSDALQAMTNPYDTTARESASVPYLWDHAYYHGKYYVYFGILPCLIFYLPWLLVTGTGFPTWLGIAICTCVYAAGLVFLLSRIVRRWFPNTSLGVFIVLDIMLFIAGGGLILARTPSMYYMPEALGLALISWGLGLWIAGTSDGYIQRGKVVLGSLLIALTIAARPQMTLAAVFGLVLFLPHLKQARGNPAQKRACIRIFIAALIPFVIVIVAVMYYNAARFSGPFDFGANYNLTTNDMTHRGFHFDRIPFGLYSYLFQPPVLGSQFPFLQQTYMNPSYQGVTIYEPMFGGYFFLYPMTMVLLAYVRVRKELAHVGLKPFFIVAVLLGFALCIFDLQGAGILMRYMSDFGLYFALAAAFVFLQLLQVRSSAPLSAGFTSMLNRVAPNANVQGAHGAHGTHASAQGAGEVVSVYRISLYFMFITLVVMVAANSLLWTAYGVY